MSLVIADGTILVQLKTTRTPLELRAPDGQLLGHFVPSLGEPLDPKETPRISEEELVRRENAGGGRFLSMILTDLEKKA